MPRQEPIDQSRTGTPRWLCALWTLVFSTFFICITLAVLLDAGRIAADGKWLGAIAVTALLGGLATYVVVRKARGARLLSLAAALVACPIAAWPLVIHFNYNCELSDFLKRSLERMLSPSERATLSPAEPRICPSAYTFVRDGKVHSAIAVDGGLFRPKIFIGNDQSP